MSSSRSNHGSRNAGPDDWLREVEDALQGNRPRTARPRRADRPDRTPRSLDDYLGDGGARHGESTGFARKGPLQDRPDEELRVWDVWKPHIVPGASILIAGLLVVSGILVGFKWFTSSHSGPSHQATFEAMWGARRRGDDVPTLESLEKAPEAKPDAAAPEAPPETAPLPEPRP